MVNKLFLKKNDLVDGKTFEDYKVGNMNIFKFFSYANAEEAKLAHFNGKAPIDYHLIVYVDENGKKTYLKDHICAERLEKRLKNITNEQESN
jgi:hypothetical protein